MVICADLKWSAMLLETQNGRKMAQIITACGRALLKMSRSGIEIITDWGKIYQQVITKESVTSHSGEF